MPAKKSTAQVVKTTKKQTAKAAEIVETAAQLPAQLPAQQLSAAAKVYHQRREAGVCVKCGQPLAPGSKLLCAAHLEYHNKWHANRKARIAQAMELLAKQTAPVAQETVAAVVEAAPTASVKPAVKAAKSKDLAALKATQPAKPAKKNSKK